MRITKFGHSCLLVEEAGARILLDPGKYNEEPVAENLDAVLITHEHDDHCFIESIQSILKGSPEVRVYTHDAVGKKLANAGIAYTPVTDNAAVSVKGVSIMPRFSKHARIHDKDPRPALQNSGYVIAGTFFYPGDALSDTDVSVEVLALPVSASWMSLSAAIDYALALKPNVVVPVHDGMLKDFYIPPTRRLPAQILEEAGIRFTDMQVGSVEEF